jgi:hypothetical protein
LQHRRRSERNSAELDDSSSPVAAANAAEIFAEGSRFGAYVIGPCVGHGGMARIYRAEHEGLRRQVALKVLTEAVEPGTEGRARFLREARIAAAIKHPNVVNIFDIGVESGVPYLVMELLVGQDLESLIAAQGALGEDTLLDIIVPVVAGLVAVHDAGIVHRDLKPGNIFLSKGPNDEVEPKLLDFGISKAAGSSEKMRLTSTHGLLMGTPLYMSPEALMGREMSPASDQYSLGVVLYECASGVNPFMADSVAETVRRVTNGVFAPMSEQAIRPSRRLQAIIERSMSLDPKQRYRDMREFGRELLQLAGQRTRITWGLTFSQATGVTRAQPPEEAGEEAIALARTRAPRRTGRTSGWPLIATAAVSAVAVLAFAWWSRREPSVADEARAPRPELGAVAPQSVVRRLELEPALAPGGSSPPLPASTVEKIDPIVQRAPVAAPERAPVDTPRVENARRDPPAPSAKSDAVVKRETAEGEGAEEAASDEEDKVTESGSPARGASVRARPPQRPPEQAEPPAPAPSATVPETPEWIIERASKPRRSKPPQRGTNNAPIFD